MVHNCIVTGCRYRKRKNIVKGIVFHSFPIDQTRLAKWHAAIAAHCPKPINITRHSKICQFHFLESDYVQTNSKSGHDAEGGRTDRVNGGHRRNTRHLKATAVPSVFEPWVEPSEVSKKHNEEGFSDKSAEMPRHETKMPGCLTGSLSPAEHCPEDKAPGNAVATCTDSQSISYSVNQILSSGTGNNHLNGTKYGEPLNPLFVRDCCLPYSSRVHPGKNDMLSHAFMIEGCKPVSQNRLHSDGYTRSSEMMSMLSVTSSTQPSRKRKNLVDTINALHKKNGAVPGKEKVRAAQSGLSSEAETTDDYAPYYGAASGTKYVPPSFNLADLMKKIRQDELHATMLTETIANMQSLGTAQSEIRAQHEFQLYHLLSKANLIHYYSAFLAAGGDDVIQLCQLSREDFNQLVELVGMANKPFHVKRLKKVLYRLRIKLRLTRSSGSDSSDNEEKNNVVRPCDYSRASSSASTPAASYSQLNNSCSALQIQKMNDSQSCFLLDQFLKAGIKRLATRYSQHVSEEVDPTGMRPEYERIVNDDVMTELEKEALLRQLSSIYPCTNCTKGVLSDHQMCVNEAAAQLCKLRPCLLTRRYELSKLSIQIATELLLSFYNVPMVPGTSGSVPAGYTEPRLTNPSSALSSGQTSPESFMDTKLDSLNAHDISSEPFASGDSTDGTVTKTTGESYCSPCASEGSASDRYCYSGDTNMETVCLTRDKQRDKTLASFI